MNYIRVEFNANNPKVTQKCRNNYIKNMYILDHINDPEVQGNPDLSTISQQPPAATSSEIVVVQSPAIESAQGTSSGTVAEEQLLESLIGTSFLPSSANLALQVIHPITGEPLEEGEIISDLTGEQMLSINEMKEIDDAEIDRMPSEPESSNVENIEEIVFEGDQKKSTYVRADGTEFNPFDGDWKQKNQEDIDEHLKNPTSADNSTDAFQEWTRRFLSRVKKPTPPEAQVDFLQFEKKKASWKILCCLFVKEIHCVVIKREYGIQYFNSLLSILSLPFYDVAALTKLELVNRSNFEGAVLFARKIRMNKKSGWKDETYKPQYPIYQQIKFTLDPATNTGRYKLVFSPRKWWIKFR
ncbi:hypothetical protein Hanom_Chr04g00288161 [Helianthus anomalus]